MLFSFHFFHFAGNGRFTPFDLVLDRGDEGLRADEVGVFYDDEIELEKVQRRRKAWGMIGTGWLTERVDFSADGNKEIIRFYYGSSSYNKRQMSRLIDNVVQDCKAVGIETRTPEQLANLISLWEASK